MSKNAASRPMINPTLRDEIASILREEIGDSSPHKALIDAARRVLPLLTWAATLRPDFINDTHALSAAVAAAEEAYGRGH